MHRAEYGEDPPRFFASRNPQATIGVFEELLWHEILLYLYEPYAPA
jgi:hypothetical protein